MSKDEQKQINVDHTLLLGFNNRESVAFADVYRKYHTEFIYFTRKIYHEHNVCPADIVHDIFLKLWESRSVKFEKLTFLKTYVYVSIRNSFLDYVSHNKYVDKFEKSVKLNSDYFVTEIVEAETALIIEEAIKLLPHESAAVFKLYVEGWEVKEIAKKLNKSQSTVYAQKQEAIKILKTKLKPHQLVALLLLLGS